jgi:hypothetical protein
LNEHVFEKPSCRPACVVFLLNYLSFELGLFQLCKKIPKRKTLAPPRLGNGMLLDLRGRCGRRDRHFFTYQTTVLTPLVLLTTVSCSTLPADLAECDLFSGLVTEEQVLPRAQAPPKVRREQPSTSATPKVASVRAPNATSRSGSGDASKKANTPPRPDAEKERLLFKEFLEWRRQTGLP